MEEPVRKSFLDVLKSNYSLADRFAVSTRFVYLGEYKGSNTDLQKKVKENVKKLNEEYGQVVFTGLLLVYPRFFIHLIEASEDTIFRHLQALLKNSEKMFGRIVPLPPYHNVYRMYFTHWYTTFIASPPLLLDKIESSAFDEVQKQIKDCLLKMYSLSEYLMTTGHKAHDKTNEALKTVDQVVQHYLPEVTVVEYIISVKSPVLEDLRNYVLLFIKVPYINFYNDSIWPPVSGFVPHTRLNETQRRE